MSVQIEPSYSLWEPGQGDPVGFFAMLQRWAKRQRKRWRQWRSFHALKRLGIVSYFDGYPSNAIPPIYADLLGLYLVTMQRKPAVLLELGGGYSTFVFAHAVRELSRQGCPVAFYSVDESDQWQKVVKDHMPDELLPFTRFVRCDATVTELNGETVSTYNSLPVEAADFVYVDGPSRAARAPGNNVSANALLLERKAPDDYAIQVDGRKETVAFLRRSLNKRYHVSRGLTGEQTLFIRTA